jgi:hypothetical protein
VSTALYPNDVTRQIVADAVNAGKKILWILNRTQSLFYNPTITKSSTAGVFPTPSDGGAAFNPDYIVQNGDTGFAAAASAAGLYTWDGTLTEITDDQAAATVLNGVTVLSSNTVVG